MSTILFPSASEPKQYLSAYVYYRALNYKQVQAKLPDKTDKKIVHAAVKQAYENCDKAEVEAAYAKYCNSTGFTPKPKAVKKKALPKVKIFELVEVDGKKIWLSKELGIYFKTKPRSVASLTRKPVFNRYAEYIKQTYSVHGNMTNCALAWKKMTETEKLKYAKSD